MDTRPHPILQRLAGTDRRSIGAADEVARAIEQDPALFGIVVDALVGDDPVLRMRAADAVEKASRDRPELLAPFKEKLLREVVPIDQHEVRWHLAQVLPRLPLDAEELEGAVAYLEDCLRDPSKIVQVNALQALVDLAGEARGGEALGALRAKVDRILDQLLETGSPAVKARGQCRDPDLLQPATSHGLVGGAVGLRRLRKTGSSPRGLAHSFRRRPL